MVKLFAVIQKQLLKLNFCFTCNEILLAKEVEWTNIKIESHALQTLWQPSGWAASIATSQLEGS